MDAALLIAFLGGIGVGGLVTYLTFGTGRDISTKAQENAPFRVGDHVLLNEYDLEPRRVHGVRRESMVGWQVFVKLSTKYAWVQARNVVRAPKEVA